MNFVDLPASGQGTLAVLIGTFNGAQYLDEQLRSVADQRWSHIDVWASDDGSTDATGTILSRWAGAWQKGRFEVMRGPSRGFAENFRSLLVNPHVGADYVAFCDQDDVWLREKTERAVAALAVDPAVPALYCSRTIVIDAMGARISHSPRFTRLPDFRNALVQNIGGGNTMVMNRAAFELVRQAARLTDFVAHDWFAYLVVSGAGGKVIYSDEPHVLYRQHGRNVIGANSGFRARLIRAVQLLKGRFTGWNAHNLRGLEACRSLLRQEAIEVMQHFALARKGSIMQRLRNLRESGVYRQNAGGQLSLFVACLLGRL